MAGLRGKAAALMGQRVRGPGPGAAADAPAVHADETPARAAGGCGTCTWLHRLPHAHAHRGPVADASTPGMFSPATPASSSATATPVLAPHRRAACLVRGPFAQGPEDLYDFEPGSRTGPRRWQPCSSSPPAPRGTPARPGTPALTRRSGQPVTRYRALAADGLRRTSTGYRHRRGRPPDRRRFLNFEDMILRFATRPDLDIFTNDLASY